MRGGRALVALVALAAPLGLPTSAPAAEVIGNNGPSVGLCPSDRARVQFEMVGITYSPSVYGVITSWSARAEATPNRTLKLLVLRRNPYGMGNVWFVVQKDEVRTLTAANQLNTFSTGVRLPIEPGERLGLYVPVQAGGGPCLTGGVAGDVLTNTASAGEPGFGPEASVDYTVPCNACRLNASALVEPDADRDGFGDETQDACPTDESTQGQCVVPETTITKGPKDRTKKKQATFEFSANVAGATFECSLDGGAFAPCTSPHSVKVKKGKHTFRVRATAKGQTDATPATDDWKVKRKKK
jgi:hypothetical protein